LLKNEAKQLQLSSFAWRRVWLAAEELASFAWRRVWLNKKGSTVAIRSFALLLSQLLRACNFN
jgi:hypothetical protein